MTQTTGISNAPIPNTAFDPTVRSGSARTGNIRPASGDEAAVHNTPGTTRLSSLGSVLSTAGAGTDDVRADKVAALKAAIDSGTYHVPASAVADKLIESLLG